jgi:ubiquinone biosynthesis protein UbiJ
MGMKQFLTTTALEATFNRLLALDPEFFYRLQKYQGQRLKLEFTHIELLWIIEIGENRFYFLADPSVEVTTHIRGSPFSLLQVLYKKREPHLFANQDIEINGDVTFAQSFLDILRDFEIDWEEMLASAIGDSAAHFMNARVRDSLRWVHNTSASISEDITDYLQEEKQLLPTAHELDDFYQEVNQLRFGIERACKRVERLEAECKK